MMRQTLRFTLHRLWSRRALMLCLLAGLVTAVAILSSVPMYSDAVNKRLLSSELADGTALPPFAFVWRYIGAFDGDIALASYRPVDGYFSTEAAGVIGLPLERQVRHLRSPRLQLLPTDQQFDAGQPLLSTNVGVLTDLEPHIRLIDGVFPDAVLPDASSAAIPVLISRALSELTGIQVGERYELQGGAYPLTVTIAGIWLPREATSDYWFYQPSVFDEMLLTTEARFLEQVAPAFETALTQAVWYQLFDGSRFLPNDVPALLNAVRRVEAQSSGLLPGVTLDASPVRALETYGRQARLLTQLLTVFAVPLVGLALYFVSLIASLIIQRDQNEIAVLRSRGSRRRQIVAIYLLEGLLVGALGLMLGLLAGRQLAFLMTRTARFLSFDEAGTPVVLSATAWQYALAALALCLLALLIPAWHSARHTIVSFRTTRAHRQRRPLLQRTYLDLLLLLPPLYGLYLLRRQGTLGSGGSVFDNPLLFLVPALFCLALALLFLRLFPYITALLARLAERLNSIAALLTLRQLARSTAHERGPLLLLCLTLSLATFSASMARTLDGHLSDQVYYQIGADLNLAELGEAVPVPAGAEAGSLGYTFLPVEDHLAVAGVEAATRVGDYRATASIGGQQSSGRLLGIDRLTLPAVAFFRPDFAGEPLVGLLNRLATRRSGLLVNGRFMQQRNLAVGDRLPLTVDSGTHFVTIPFVIVGSFDLFPTWVPQDGALFIAHLDYVHEAMDGAYPYDVWLRSDGTSATADIVSQLRQRGFTIVTAQDAQTQITGERTRPARQGLFGLLSVGFLAAALLTVLGYLVYAVVGFQRRFVELGMLRALGLSTRQMVGHLASEQALLIVGGSSIGTLIGVVASRLFIPFLQVGSGRTALTPPFLVQIAWGQLWTIWAVFGLMLVVAIVVLVGFLARMRVFEAVKLGETV